MEKEKDLIGKLEVCELLGISKRNLERWIAMGLIPSVRVENEIKFDEIQILNWISSKELFPKDIEDFKDRLLIGKMEKQRFEVGQMNQYLRLKKILSLIEAVKEDGWAYREEIIEDKSKTLEQMSYKEKLEKFNAARLNMDSLSVDDPDFNSKFKAAREVIEKWKKILNESDPIADQIEFERAKEVKRIYAKEELQSVIEETFKGVKI